MHIEEKIENSKQNNLDRIDSIITNINENFEKMKFLYQDVIKNFSFLSDSDEISTDWVDDMHQTEEERYLHILYDCLPFRRFSPKQNKQLESFWKTATIPEDHIFTTTLPDKRIENKDTEYPLNDFAIFTYDFQSIQNNKNYKILLAGSPMSSFSGPFPKLFILISKNNFVDTKDYIIYAFDATWDNIRMLSDLTLSKTDIEDDEVLERKILDIIKKKNQFPFEWHLFYMITKTEYIINNLSILDEITMTHLKKHLNNVYSDSE